MKCSITGCPGEYEEQKINHTVRHRGEIFVIDEVPAEVCTVCGDVLLTPAIVRHIEELLQAEAKPSRMVPLLNFASA
ncbi:MAG: YgiT-type zinc finger protein [bacterium]|nr:YgiT-type zinc finger protein [bacterium]